MGVCLAVLLGRLPALAHAPAGSLDGGLFAQVTASLVSLLFFAPLFLYGVAALARIVARAFGGTGGWYETRLATFWGLLVAAPLQLSAALLADVLSVAGQEGLGRGLTFAAGLGAGWIWASCLAEAHGFRSVWAVVAGLFVAVNAVFLAIFLLAAGS